MYRALVALADALAVVLVLVPSLAAAVLLVAADVPLLSLAAAALLVVVDVLLADLALLLDLDLPLARETDANLLAKISLFLDPDPAALLSLLLPLALALLPVVKEGEF